MSKENWTTIDTGLRRLIEARSAERGETLVAYLGLMFPKMLETADEAPPETEEPQGDVEGAESEVVEEAIEKLEPEVSFDDLRGTASRAIRVSSADTLKKLLAQFKAKRLSDLEPDSYRNFQEVLMEDIIEPAEAKANG